MSFIVPEGFTDGKVAVRVGDRIEEFWSYCLDAGYGSEWQLSHDSDQKIINFDEYIAQWGQRLCVAYNFHNDKWLSFDQDAWYASHGAQIIDLPDPVQSCEDILDFL